MPCRFPAPLPSTRGATRLAFGISALVAVAAWAVGCGESQPPIATGNIPGLTVEVGNTESVDLAGFFSDADGDVLSYTATSSNSSVATTTVSGATVYVTAVGAGGATVTVTASDPDGLSAVQIFSVTVPNRAPVAVGRIPDGETFVGESFEVALAGYFSDPDGDALTYTSISSSPDVATAIVAAATVRVTGVGQGTVTVTITATDPGGLLATQAFSVTVPNRAPVAVGQVPDAETFVGGSVEIALAEYFSDPDGDDLAYSATSSSPGVVTVSVTGATARVAGVAQGAATVTVTASDPGGLSASQTFAVTVPNRAPVAVGEIDAAETFVGESFEIALAGYFSDPDGDDLTYAAASSYPGVATVAVRAAIARVAGVAQGAATVTVTASDPGGLSATQTFAVTVPNRAPVAIGEINDAETFVGESFEIALAGYFGDPDGDDLAYAATSSSPGVATVAVTGATARVAGVAQGAATVTVTASDPGRLSASQTFAVTVPNRAPVAIGEIDDLEFHGEETVYVALADHFTDPDGDDLSYSASSSDEDVATVAISGDTMTVTRVARGSAEITVTASDGSLSASQDFIATVVPTDREVLEILYDELDGDNWTYNASWKSTAPLEDWYGVHTDTSGRVTDLTLFHNDLDGRLPAVLGDLDSLRTLSLWSNRELSGKIPPELGNLTRLKTIYIAGTGLSGEIPPELGDIKSLTSLLLFDNDLTGEIPPELGDLSRLKGIYLSGNELTGGIPAELGKLDSVGDMSLAGNKLTGPIPPELGDLSSLWYLSLHSNDLSGPIPPELGDLSSLQYLYLHRNSLSGPIPPELGDLSSLQDLYLRRNSLSGPIPSELGDLSGLLRLHISNNADLEGKLPSSFSSLTSLASFYAHGTGVCVQEALWDWYFDIESRSATLCESPAAYLVQAAQSRDNPVPVVADKQALLRVFVTATRATTETLPPATATFYVDGSETYSVEIDGTTETIPRERDEGSLAKSLNVTIPASEIEEGLSVVIDIDPDSTIDADILVAKRIPESGKLHLGVEGVPDFEFTVIPFLYTEDPDSSVLDHVDEMESEEEEHELLHDTYDLLPIEEMSVEGHDPVEIDTESMYDVLARTGAIRAAESGSGYWMGLMEKDRWGVLGVAWVGGTTSASVPDAWVMAHELGHNLSLWHAPCGGPANVDPDYPYEDGSIGAWGYDHRGDSLIDKDRAKDLMTYCRPEWVSDYHFEKAVRYRTAEAMMRGEESGRRGPSLLVWGSRSASGELSMDPALVVEGRSLLPQAPGDYTLTGLDAARRELFSVSFDMEEPADAEEGTGMFVFLLPVEPRWEALASIALAGPGDALFTLDGGTEATMAWIRDVRSGQVRAIRGDLDERPSAPPGHVVRWSRGIPDRDAWRPR